MYYHLLCQTQPYDSDSFNISVTSVICNSETAVKVKVKSAKTQIPRSGLFHTYTFHFTPVSLTSLPAWSPYLYFPTSTPPAYTPYISISPIFNFPSPVFSDASTRLPNPCLSSSFWCRVGAKWEDTCTGKGTSRVSDQLGNLTTFPYHLLFLASSDPFLMAKRIVQQATNSATLLLDF